MPHIASKRFTSAADREVYAYLRLIEENNHAARGGIRRVLVAGPGGNSVVRELKSPSPTLAALRADQPVTVPGWKIPREFRTDFGTADHVRVHPDGRIEKQ